MLYSVYNTKQKDPIGYVHASNEEDAYKQADEYYGKDNVKKVKETTEE